MTFKVVGDKLTLCDEYSLCEFYRNDMYEYEETVSGKTFSSYEDFYSAVEKSGYDTKMHNHVGYEDAEFDVNNDDYTTAQCFKGNHIFTLLDSRGMLTAEQYGFIHDNTNLTKVVSKGTANENPPTSSYIEIMDYYNLNTYEFAEQFNMQIAEGPGGCNAFGTSEYLYRRGEWANFYSISLHSNSEQTNLKGAFQTSIISEKYGLYGVCVGMTFSECKKVLDSKGFSLDDTKTWNVDKSYYYYFYDSSDNQIQLNIYDNQCDGIDYYPNI